MEQLKNNLWHSIKQAKPLMTSSYMILTPGQSRYSCPSDFSSDMSMVVLTGSITGQAVAATTNTLQSPASIGPLSISQVLGQDLAIISGSASGSVSQVTGLVLNGDGSSTLSVYPNFQSVPDATSRFVLISNQYPVEADHIANYDRFRSSGIGRPRKFFSIGDANYDGFIFDVAPDNSYPYVIRMRYFVNIMTLDLASPLMTTLYQKFREYWEKGIRAQALMDNDDTRAAEALQERNSKLQELVASQIYGQDIHTLRQHVEDYY